MEDDESDSKVNKSKSKSYSPRYGIQGKGAKVSNTTKHIPKKSLQKKLYLQPAQLNP